ncbi:MAG: threonine--tRNA ligase [Planctomycetota bacterium]|nr:threonine--tRNA ligase [Planctomycetota bacterium]MCX8040018.1 threonine--tRNA ligase [Planctomycetota bacterium]MDW8372610.1 threonine--tRNA ligase [Planctomycetota bacterium]
MPQLTLPDGSVRDITLPTTGRELAALLPAALAARAIGIKVGNEIRDLASSVTEDAPLRVILADDRDPDALYLLRHSAAHVLAEAVCALFPGTRLAYGPPTDEGFFYDLAPPRAISEDDFPAIEAKMREIIAADRPFTRCEYEPAAGLARTAGDKYKTDNAERALARGAPRLSFYVTGIPGEGWEDLCAGPHVPSTKWLSACKLLAVSGAYWHGDQRSDRLTRIYGTCFASEAGLQAYLRRIEEAKQRDHRKLGKELDLFHIEEDNPGQVFWHPRGWTIYLALMEYMRAKQRQYGYVEVHTPTVMARALWERSGHWDKYRDNMFITESEKRDFAIKPMNCPGHILIYKQGLKSYRDLPLRIAEFGSCVRNEASGALHGILRVRGFVQDDAHIFCREDQVESEVALFCRMLTEVYADFGFGAERIEVKLSTRPAQRIGSDESWDRAEAALANAVRAAGLSYAISPGDGAFYGPKLEFTLVDALGRGWQCGTIQLDTNLPSPERLDAHYIGEDGQRHPCVMLHRAILGSLERFIGILIEHFAGRFPLWLAPEQLRILPVSDDHLPYARQVRARCQDAGLRATVDERADKLGAKIREARLMRVNYFAVVGAQEAAAGTVSLQDSRGQRLGAMPVEALVQRLREEVTARRLPAPDPASAA